MNYPISVTIEIPKIHTVLINTEDDTKCFNHCKHLKYSDYNSTIESVHCSLFHKDIEYSFDKDYIFTRCDECINNTKQSLNTIYRNKHYR